MVEKFNLTDQEWANELEKGVEEYTDGLFESVWDGPDGDIPTLSGEPFCACSTCFWRETLHYLVPRLIEGYKNGKVELIEE